MLTTPLDKQSMIRLTSFVSKPHHCLAKSIKPSPRRLFQTIKNLFSNDIPLLLDHEEQNQEDKSCKLLLIDHHARMYF